MSPPRPAGRAEGWNATAQAHWLRGDRQAAIDAVLAVLNAHGAGKPVKLVLQLAYYIFLLGDPRGAAGILELTRAQHPRDPELLVNLAVCLARSGQDAPAVDRLRDVLAIQPDNALAHDTLCSALYRLERFAEAAAAGTRSLALKDAAQRPAPRNWRLPPTTPAAWAARPGKRPVVAFSLWGAAPRYLRGAIDNALAGPRVYPGWTMRFHLDETVPAEIRDALRELGAEVRLEAPGQDTRHRLAWRFKVANDPAAGRFLVRDVNSVVGEREKSAVDEWMRSDRWFHVMRDWWTHTDPMLAGMWGGVAGALPPLTQRLAAYKPPAMETPNIDQWFLRDEIWRYVRTSCLVHDRCFTLPGTEGADARPWPEAPPEGGRHVGQDEFAAWPAEQALRLTAWLPRLKSLEQQVKPPPEPGSKPAW